MDHDDPLMQAEIERDERVFRLAHTDSTSIVDRPTVDDAFPDVRLRGAMPTRYPIITAS